MKLFLTDKHFLIRKLAIEYVDKLGQKDIDKLLNDKSANVRLQTLYGIKNESNFNAIIELFLADNAASIRHFARFTLKHTNLDFAVFYNQKLQEGNQIIGSLSGLAEIEAKQHSEIVKKYLNNTKIKIRKTAFIALCKLDEENAYQFAFSNLETSYAGLRNVIIDYLSHTPRQEVMTKAREIYKSEDCGLKKSMLNLFHKVGGWTVIPDLMMGTIDGNENIRQLASGYLQIWRTRAARLFSTPKQEEIQRAKQIFKFVNETHEEKQYFKTNPVDGLDFYFK